MFKIRVLFSNTRNYHLENLTCTKRSGHFAKIRRQERRGFYRGRKPAIVYTRAIKVNTALVSGIAIIDVCLALRIARRCIGLALENSIVSHRRLSCLGGLLEDEFCLALENAIVLPRSWLCTHQRRLLGACYYTTRYRHVTHQR